MFKKKKQNYNKFPYFNGAINELMGRNICWGNWTWYAKNRWANTSTTVRKVMVKNNQKEKKKKKEKKATIQTTTKEMKKK